MNQHELRQIIRAKNEAWKALAEATHHVMAYQQVNHGPNGYHDLPDGWEERRDELRQQYQDARQRYLRAMLRRRQ